MDPWIPLNLTELGLNLSPSSGLALGSTSPLYSRTPVLAYSVIATLGFTHGTDLSCTLYHSSLPFTASVTAPMAVVLHRGTKALGALSPPDLHSGPESLQG